MSVFTVFAIGTGHSRAERDTLMVRLYNDCQGTGAEHLGSPVSQAKLVLDGIGKDYDPTTGEVSSNMFAQMTGWGLKDRSADAVEHIMRLRPDVVNLTGHSRGAIICVRIAAKLAEKLPGTRCNLFLVDPVKRSLIGTDHDNAETHSNTGLFRQMIMENESSWAFKPQAIRHSHAAGNTVHMPGTHGTGTQTGQPVGMVTFMLVANFLRLCGSAMRSAPFGPAALCDGYSRITLANPVKRRAAGVGRVFADLDSGGRGFKVGGHRGTGGVFGPGNAFKDDSYFINGDHAKHFTQAFPMVFGVMTGAVRPDPSIQMRLAGELQTMRSQAPRAFQTLPAAFRSFV